MLLFVNLAGATDKLVLGFLYVCLCLQGRFIDKFVQTHRQGYIWPLPSRDALHFVVEVELPTRHSAVRYIPSFQANLPLFALNMDDISALRFGDVSLETTNSHIKVQVIIHHIYTRNC